MDKLTKQGVRNLDALGPKAPKRRESFPPDTFMCTHRGGWTPTNMGYSERCNDCGHEEDIAW